LTKRREKNADFDWGKRTKKNNKGKKEGTKRKKAKRGIWGVVVDKKTGKGRRNRKRKYESCW